MDLFFKGIFDNGLTQTIVVGIGDTGATIRMPSSMSELVIVLEDNSPSVALEDRTERTLDENGVAWY